MTTLFFFFFPYPHHLRACPHLRYSLPGMPISSRPKPPPDPAILARRHVSEIGEHSIAASGRRGGGGSL